MFFNLLPHKHPSQNSCCQAAYILFFNKRQFYFKNFKTTSIYTKHKETLQIHIVKILSKILNYMDNMIINT